MNGCYIIKGGNILEGLINNDTAKNACLPIIIASLLTENGTILNNIPDIGDIHALAKLISELGAVIEMEEKQMKVFPEKINVWSVPAGNANKIRPSILLLGVLLHKFGKTSIPLPGGDSIGTRKIDSHLHTLRTLGAKVIEKKGYIIAKCKKLEGTEFRLYVPSVGATESAIIAASVANGTSIIRGVAKEPEIVDLANFLNLAGANIKGAGTDTIIIEGADSLHSVEYTPIPDRMAAATYATASAITGGDIIIKNVNIEHLQCPIDKIKKMGITIRKKRDSIRVIGEDILPINIATEVYPGFPTDLQPIFTSLLSIASGKSKIIENIFDNRFHHVYELKKMRAEIKVKDRCIHIDGVNELQGATVYANDIRCGAALVLAGLIANGTTRVYNIEQIERGYEKLERKLTNVGAVIKRGNKIG